MSAIVLILYASTAFFFSDSLATQLTISMTVVISSAIAFLGSLLLYFLTPAKLSLAGSIVVYLLLLVTIGTLIIQSGGIHSPFIVLWMAVSIFGGIFGLPGIICLLLLANGYIIYSFIDQSLSRYTIILSILAVELPIIISYIIWGGRDEVDEQKDESMHSLNQELTVEASKSEAIIKAIGDGVMVVDSTGDIKLINPAAQQIVGWNGKDAAGLHYESVLKLESAKGEAIPELENPIARVLNTNQQVRENNLIIITKSGKHLSAAFVVTPIGDSGQGAIAVFRDVTKERAEEREQAEFISTASHEMRTPVASIEGYLGLALNPNTAQIDDKARDFINKAHESAQHLGRLFQDLLDITRLEDNRLQNNPRVIEVVAFARDIMEGLAIKAKEKNLTLIYRPDASKTASGTVVIAPILYSYVDKDHLREVLANLIENAIKYTPSGQVAVDLTGDSEHITISIKDSGIGIPAEDISHLFQKFYRVDNSDTREIGGTGLGLYLCRRLIESMEGRIWVESEYKKGSTFFIELPRLSRDDALRLEATAQQKDNQEQARLTSQTTPQTHGDVTENLETPALTSVIESPPPTAAPTPTPAPVPAPQQQQPQPVPTPQPSPTPPPPVQQATPSAPPTPVQPPATTFPQPRVAPRAATQPVIRENIPLSSLERNPEHYTSKRE